MEVITIRIYLYVGWKKIILQMKTDSAQHARTRELYYLLTRET